MNALDCHCQRSAAIQYTEQDVQIVLGVLASVEKATAEQIVIMSKLDEQVVYDVLTHEQERIEAFYVGRTQYFHQVDIGHIELKIIGFLKAVGSATAGEIVEEYGFRRESVEMVLMTSARFKVVDCRGKTFCKLWGLAR